MIAELPKVQGQTWVIVRIVARIIVGVVWIVVTAVVGGRVTAVDVGC